MVHVPIVELRGGGFQSFDLVRLCRRNYVAGAPFLSSFMLTAGLQSIVALFLCQGVCCIVYNGVKVSSLLSFPCFCVLLLSTAVVTRILYCWIPFSHCVASAEGVVGILLFCFAFFFFGGGGGGAR